jgi:arylsulfatase A-like enzyme
MRRGPLPLVLLLLYAACATPPRSEARPPNVVFVLADDLGFMDVRPNNPDTLYDTPNLDRLAARGMRFSNGYAACPVCSPSRYSLQTGRYPTRAKLTDWFSSSLSKTYRPADYGDRMALDEVTIAEHLRERGYATFFAGKWHLGPQDYWPENQGYDVNKGGIDRGGPYGGRKYFSPYDNPRLPDGPDGEHLPDRLASETCKFLAANQARPCFAFLSFYSVHTPLMGRPDLVAKYEARLAEHPLQGEEFGDEEQVWPGAKPRRVRIQQRHAIYAAMVEAMDEAIGKVLDQIDALGLADNTIVVFTSDNGGLSTSEGSPTSNLPLRGGKGWLYEGGIREPWIAFVPGTTQPGSVCDQPISSIDALPTLLELTGSTAATQAIDGVSFAPALRGEQMPERPLYWHYPHYSNQGGFPGGAVRLGDWKLLERYEDGRVSLFDLAHDVREQNDLAAQQPEKVIELLALLHDFYRRFDAQFLRAQDGGPEPWRPEITAAPPETAAAGHAAAGR